MKQFIICALALCTGCMLFQACDNATEPNDLLADSPAITSLEVTPLDFNFTQTEDGFKDTTLTFNIRANAVNLPDNYLPLFSIYDKGDSTTLIEGELESSGTENEFEVQFDYETNTTAFEEFIINVFIYDKSGAGNYAQASLSINGFSNFPPEILATTSPDTIYRPSTGSVPAVFTAAVTDTDGDDTIGGVFLRIIDQETGEVEGSPFLMADDGMSLGDETANDMTYTWSLGVPAEPASGRIERDYDIEFFAIDKGNLSSDTVKTTFRIRE